MNIRELEYFVAIAEHGHFGKAARVVNVSQPTLSMQFKKLEESLGGKLLERLPKGAKLTPLGEEVLPLAKKVLQLCDDIEQHCGDKRKPGRIRLGIIPTISPYLLPRINRQLRKTLEDKKILLSEAQTADLIKFVRDGSLDAAILSTPIEESGLEELDIYSEPFFLAVSQSHPLASRKKVSLADIKDEQILLLGEGHCLRKQALSICNFSQSGHEADFSATSIETLRNMVALGAGITLIPKMALRESDQIAYIPFAEKSFSRKIGIIYRSSFYDKAFIQALASIIKRTA